MRVNHIAKRISSVLLLLCIIVVMMTPMSVSATENEYICIAVNEYHKNYLVELFKNNDDIIDYSGKQHVVELIVGSKQQLYIVSTFEHDQNVEWESSDPNVVSVSEDGSLTAIRSGTAIITANCENKSATVTVDVVNRFDLNHNKAYLSINKLCNLDIVTNGDLTDYVYYAEWVTTNESLALVGKGLVLASKTGTGEIVAYLHERGTGKQVGVAYCSIEVFPDITSVAIVNKASKLELGSTMQLNIKTIPEHQHVIWESSDETVATVDKNGLLTAVGVGTVTISAYGGVWNDNEYHKLNDVVSKVTVEIWSDATTKYNISIKNGSRGEITANKTSALAGETITVVATHSYDKNGSQIEAFGATALSVVDENGMAVTVTNEGSGIFSFVMPKSPVSVSAVYSSLYGVSCETALKTNFARNDNLVGKVTINEFVGGSFSGSITFSSPNVVLSNVSTTHGDIVKNEDGTITVVVDNDREIATDIVFSVYADAQTVSDGSHSISISGDLQMNIENSFVACTAGKYIDDAFVVDLDYVDNLLSGSTLTISSKDQIVIYGEALKYIMENYISMELMFDSGSITIPYSSLSDIEVEQGDFTVISMGHSSDVFDSEKTLGKYSLSARTYTTTGSSKNQMNMIGKVSVIVKGPDDSLLTLQTGSQTITANKNGVFELQTMAGLETFTVLIGGTGMSIGDIVSTIIIIVLIIALIVAVVFLLKRMQVVKHDTPKPNNVKQAPIEEDQIEEDVFDEQAFKTVDDILRESNLSEELEMIRNDALSEIKLEIDREIAEASISIEQVKKYETIPNLREAVGISSNDVDLNDLESKYFALSDTIRVAEDSRISATKILENESETTTDVINRETDSIRSAVSDMIKARESFAQNIDSALSMLNQLLKQKDPEKEAREKLSSAINLASDKSEQLFSPAVQEAHESLQHIDNAMRHLPTISSEFALEMNTAASYCSDLLVLDKRLTNEMSVGTSMLQPSEVYFSPEEMEYKSSEILSLVDNMTDLIHRDHNKSIQTGLSAKEEFQAWNKSEMERIAKEKEEAERVQAEGMSLLNQIKSNTQKYLKLKAGAIDAFENLSECVDNSSCDDISISNLKERIEKLEVDELDLADAMENIDLNDQHDPQITEDTILHYKGVLSTLDTLIDSADKILNECVAKTNAIVQQSLKNRLQSIQDIANAELQVVVPELNNFTETIDPDDFVTNSVIFEIKQNIEDIKAVSQKANALLNSNIVNPKDVDDVEKELNNLIVTLRKNLDTANKSMRDFQDEKENKRIAELEQLAKEKRKEEEMQIEIERQSKIRELMQRRKAAIELASLTTNHKKLVEKFEDCINLVAAEHAANMLYLNSIDSDSKTDDHLHLNGCSCALYKNANEIYASNYWEMSDSMLSQLITAIKQDIEFIVRTRNFLTGQTNHQSLPSFKVQRLPRKKLRYWQNQMESRNPYVALLAMAKVENHKLRVKHGVVAHQAKNSKR